MKNDTSLDIGTLQKGKSVTTLYLAGLNYSKNEADIKKQFERFGMVSYVRMIRDAKTQKKKGIAFVQMPNKIDALKAVKVLNGKQWAGRTLKVEVARDNEAKKEEPKKVKFTAKPVQAMLEKEEKAEKKKPNRKLKGLNLLFENIKN